MTKISAPRATGPQTSHYFNAHPRNATTASGSANESAARFSVRAAGRTLEFATAPGVFSRSGLDDGSRLLLATAGPAIEALPAGACCCDLGCGWGPVGCFLATLAPHLRVSLVDINFSAVQLARNNYLHNGLTNVDAWCGDGLSAARDKVFDAVLCNPPVRAGNRVIAQLFDDAYRCVRSGGSLWVVLRTAQGAKSWERRLHDSWGNCTTMAIDKGYRILRSDKGTA